LNDKPYQGQLSPIKKINPSVILQRKFFIFLTVLFKLSETFSTVFKKLCTVPFKFIKNLFLFKGSTQEYHFFQADFISKFETNFLKISLSQVL